MKPSSANRSLCDQAYARAAAILERSQLGLRWGEALRCHTLRQLAHHLFPGEAWVLPDKLLAVSLQSRLDRSRLLDVLTVLDCLETAPELLRCLPGAVEAHWLKQALACGLRGSPVPAFPPLGKWARLKPERWPDWRAMVQRTAWGWLCAEAPATDAWMIQARIDRQLAQELMAATAGLADGEAVSRLVSTELALRNASWALRLRVYYRMDAVGAAPCLVGTGQELLGPALQVFERSLADPEAWRDWRFREYLDQGAAAWPIDPLAFERAVLRRQPGLFRRFFHAQVGSLGALYAFGRLMRLEAAALISLTEGLVLGLDAARLRRILPLEGLSA